MATTTSQEELEFSSKDKKKPVSNELYAKFVQVIRSLKRGEELNVLRAMTSISRSLG